MNAINAGTTDFVATYTSPNLTIDVSGSGRRGDSFIIAPSTPVGNAVDIAAPITTVLQKIFTISGTPSAVNPPGAYNFTIQTQPPATGCASVTFPGRITIDPSATIATQLDNTGTSICDGSTYTGGVGALMRFQVSEASGMRIDPLTPLPNGLVLSLSASGTFNQYEITGQVNAAVVTTQIFNIDLVTFGATCSDATESIVITVDPSPDITPVNPAITDQTVCVGVPIVPIRFQVFDPAVGLSLRASSTFPDGVTGQSYSQNQFTQIEVDFSITAADVTSVGDVFNLNINNVLYT